MAESEAVRPLEQQVHLLEEQIENLNAINDEIQEWISRQGTELKIPASFLKLLSDLHWALQIDGGDERG